MKLELLVLRPRKMAGRCIPITLSQFLIGRDAHCQLRPASSTVSMKHCALLVRGEQAFIQDFNSTNGTFVNDKRIQGERQLQDGDRLQIGRLEFRVAMPAASAIDKPSGESLPSPTIDEEAAGALLLALEDDGPAPGSQAVDREGIPTGSTVILPPNAEKAEQNQPKPDAGPGGAAAAKRLQGSTSSAAQDILKRYRRPKG
jgi:pSer/pThr/pTyr-binding forkhead associated (FHA) protein